MNTRTIILSFFLITFFNLVSNAQFDPKNICRLDNDQLIFKLDQQWTDTQRKEVSRLFDLDSLLLVDVFDGRPFISADSVTWQVHTLKQGLVEISKMLTPPPPQFLMKGNDVIGFSNFWMELSTDKESQSFVYGVNNFSDKHAFSYEKGNARFFLPGYSKAKKIFISGTFNTWSTMQSAMQRTDSGWIFSAMLKPGRYAYKFIIDGRWKTDPNNKSKEDDNNGGDNSVVFCPNHIFSLNGFSDARSVVLSGSFNGWNERELKMQRIDNVWELPVYLKEGTHAYKFIVDKEWITDPSNPIVRPDGNGNINSFMALGDTLVFRLQGHTSSSKVTLAGSFNAWNSEELMMLRDSTGWYLPYVLAKGNYEYKFVVDGNWMADPVNPYSTGLGDQYNSFIAFKYNYTFELDSFPNAKQVIVTGSFCNWDPGRYKMSWQSGKWIFPIYLEPGKYTYKFIVDGNWIQDPKNELWEENEYGTHNSVLWLEAGISK